MTKIFHCDFERIEDSSQLDALKEIEEDEEMPFDDGIFRKRLSLTELLTMAVQNELSQAERDAIELYWFKGMSISQAARQLGINRATAGKTLERAKGKLYKSLKYAVMFWIPSQEAKKIPLLLDRDNNAKISLNVNRED